MKSIRYFLVIVLLATVTLFNFLAALQGYRTSIDNAEHLFDEQLVDLAALLSYSDLNHQHLHVREPINNNILFQIWKNPDLLLEKSSNAPDVQIINFESGYHYATYNNFRWRVLVVFDDLNNNWIVVAEQTNNRYLIAESIALQSILPNILGLPLLGLLIWLIVGSGLKPLRELADALSLKKHNDLSPLQLNETPKELQKVIDSTNDLLLRLENSFAREKRFSGDAAHELRTPLSALKIQLYNLGKVLPEDNVNIKLVNESIDRMVHLIEQMLALYRTTPEQFMAKFANVDIYKLTQQIISERYANIALKNQQIELIGETCLLTGDQFALETLVKNLLDNANKYTPEGGSILVSIIENEKTVALCVEDSGVGIPEPFYERVFERFYRVNGDQHNSMVVGCGLGLSIVQHIVELHSGSIELASSRFASGLKVTVTLPKQQTISESKGVDVE